LNAEHAQALRDALARYVGGGAAGRRRYAAACPGRAPGTGRWGRQHRGPRMGQDARHRGEGPRPGTSRADGQIQGRDRTVAAGTPSASRLWSPYAHAEN
jgi:hypothetical protein